MNEEFPKKLTLVAGILTLTVILAMGFQHWRSLQYMTVLKEKHIPTTELSTTIMHLNDILTDSAYLAVLTGFPRWQERYRKFDPALEHATRKFVDLVSDSVDRATIEKLETTRKGLSEIEAQALKMGSEKLEEAFSLLDSEKYQGLKLSYNRTVFDIVGLFSEQRKQALASHFSMAKLTVIGFLASLMVLIATWTFVIRVVRSYERSRQKMYLQLSQAAKLTSLGTLSSGVAHELRNPLTVVKGLAQQFELEDDLSPELKEQARHIVEEATRIETITDQLRSFAREGSDTEWGPVNVNESIQRSLNLLNQQLKSRNISLELKLADNLPQICGNSGSVESVVQNLIANARDAFAELPEIRDHKITIQSQLEANGNVVVTVSDNAGGIAENIEDQLFDPFFTTKGGKGTGLGLSIVHGIMQQHKGSVDLKNDPGKGAAFVLTFPKADQAQSGPAKAA